MSFRQMLQFFPVDDVVRIATAVKQVHLSVQTPVSNFADHAHHWRDTAATCQVHHFFGVRQGIVEESAHRSGTGQTIANLDVFE